MSAHNGNHQLRRPLVVELAGPAGVGKSTLAAALAQRFDSAPREIWGLPVLSLLGNGASLIPTFAGLWRHSRSPLWNEARHMVRLRTLHRRLGRGRSGSGRVLIFDEGPVFALAWLRGFGHATMRSQPAESWWRATLAEWAASVDVIIVLDATDSVLAQRIRRRPVDHEVKEFSDPDIAIWMARFRQALAWVLTELVGQGKVKVLRLTTDQDPVALAEQLIETMNGGPYGA